jgi:peptide/nickel transport system substrate-binding protein
MKLRLRAIPVMAAATLLLIGLGACSSGAPAAGSGSSSSGAAAGAAIAQLTGGDVNFYSNVDPNKTQGCNDNYCGLFMEHLLQLGPGNTLEPELATSVTQPNSVTYVYHLRHGVTFWDGSPMTSADVVYSLDYQSKPGVPTSVYFANVKSIAADGPNTVVITLKQPDAGWKYSLSYEGVIFEKAFALAHPGTMGNPGVLIEATGPWEIKSLDPTRGMELTANPHWWDGKVPVSDISVKFFSTETSMALAMRSGEIDVAFPQDGESFASVSGTKLTSFTAPGVNFFAMDASVGPWADVHVRRAVAYALNRTDLIAANGGPVTARPTSQIIQPAQLLTVGTPSQVNALLNSLPQYPYDLAKARQEMAQSAYPHGFTAVTEVGPITNYPTVVQAIAAELHPIGITLKIQQVSTTKYLADYSASSGPPGGDMYGGLGAVSPDPSILPSYMVGTAATYNVARYMPAWSNSLLASGLATSDPAQRLALYGQLLKQVGADVPYVPLFSGYSFVALSSKYALPPFPDYAAFFSWALNLKRSAS